MEDAKNKVLIVIAIICLLGTASLIIFDSMKPKPSVTRNIAYVEETTESTTTTTTSTTTQVMTTTVKPTTTINKTTKATVRR